MHNACRAVSLAAQSARMGDVMIEQLDMFPADNGAYVRSVV
jgi:hypothetical protein